MGLLDDAIREHLDLKRRRGADPAELERAEREALGPVRRKGDVATADYPDDADEAFETADAEDAPVGSVPFAYDQAEEHDWSDRGDALAVDDAEAEIGPESQRRSRRSGADDDVDQKQPRGLAARFGLRGHRSEEDDRDEPAPDRDEPEPDPPSLSDDDATRVHRPSAARGDRPPPAIDEETAEHDIASGAPNEGDENEDVLEETPEFLQDTPDHDRLWFEQRPPRDFDFDG
jgi:hypothetical protein